MTSTLTPPMHSNTVDLVTVTCARDFGIQELQAYSVNEMIIKSCNHYIVVEDSKLDLETWYKMLCPYYNRHHLHLISGSSLLPNYCYQNDSYKKNGWHRSAALKLLVGKQIQSKKYLILDSKNFFVRKQSLDDWPLADGNGILNNYNSYGWTELEAFCSVNNIPIPNQVYDSATPFIVDTGIIHEILKFDILPLFFEKKGWWSSELFLYSIFTQWMQNTVKEEPVTNLTFWKNERRLNYETLNDIYNWPNMRTFGLHREVCQLDTDLCEFVDFLVGIGFDKPTVERTLTRYALDTKIYVKK